MGLVVSSINSNKIILKTGHAESDTQTLEGYSKVARFFRAIIEYISRITCCCCPMQPLLKVSLKDKAVYLHPDQIKDCFKTLKLGFPAKTRICQDNLHHYINVTIPQQQNGNVGQSGQSTQPTEPIKTNPTKPVDSGSVKPPIRVNIQRSGDKFVFSDEVVEKYLFENLGYQRHGNPNDSDVIFCIYGPMTERVGLDLNLHLKKLDRPKNKPLVCVFISPVDVPVGSDISPAQTPRKKFKMDETHDANGISITLVSQFKPEAIPDISWNQQQLDECREFLKKQTS